MNEVAQPRVLLARHGSYGGDACGRLVSCDQSPLDHARCLRLLTLPPPFTRPRQAFLIPAIEALVRSPPRAGDGISVLVLSPTRELASQVGGRMGRGQLARSWRAV